MIRFLLHRLRGHRAAVAFAVLLTVSQVLADVLGALPIKFVVDKIVDHSDPNLVGVPTVIGWFDRYGSGVGLRANEQHSQTAVILGSSLLFIVFAGLSAILTYVQMRIATSVAQNVSANLRTELFGRIQALPLDWHATQRAGDVIQRVTANITDIEKLITDGLVDLLAGVLSLLAIVAVMLFLNWRFTLLAVGVIPILFVVVLRYTLMIKAASRATARAAASVTEVATEDIRAITEIKAFTLETHEANRFANRVITLRENATRTGRLQAQFTPLVFLVIAVGTAVIIGVGGQVAAGYNVGIGPLYIPASSLTVGTLAVYLSYLKQLYQPMRNLSKLANMSATAASGAHRIVEILDATPERVEEYGPDERRFQGHIRFDDVIFGYDKGRAVLRGVSFEIEPQKRVALVGLSGSGKSTIAKLIPRFHTAWTGSVNIDGVNVTQLDLGLLRRNISFVPQESVLFEGTVRENLAIGRPTATDAEIVAATTQAHMHESILEMPDGYQTWVREGGKNLSSGQRQRLAIARALLRDTPILILDEPTASLDVEAEAEVMHALDTLIQGRTVLMISHRLSTLGHVDEIIVLQEGAIVERGSPTSLRKANGVFARMLNEQNRYSGTERFRLPSEVPTVTRAPESA